MMDLDALREAVEFLDGWDVDAPWVDEAHRVLRAVLDSEEAWKCRNPRPEKCINEASRTIGVEISERDPGLGVDHSDCGWVREVRRRLLAEEGT